ncbi:MAG: MarR family winged helix-turn-helix transcriptional regulator [Marmoricola sp.]
MTQPSDARLLGVELVAGAGRLVRVVSREAGHDVPSATLRLLAQINDLAPTTVSALAEAERCAQPTMSIAVSGLVAKGWAAKSANPDDGRSHLVTLTQAGTRVLTDARTRNGAVIAGRLAASPDHDLEDLAATVSVLQSLLQQTPEGSS